MENQLQNVTPIEQELKKLFALRKDRDEAKEKAKGLEAEYKKEERRIYELMESQGIGSIKIEGLGNFIPTEKIWSKVVDPEAFKEWAAEEGLLEELVKEAFETGRINQLMKQRMEEGEDPIPGVEMTPTPYISIRKG